MIDKENLKKYLRIVGIILFFYILSQVNWSEFILIFKRINIFYFIIGVIFIFPVILTRTLKWKELINSLNITIPLKALIPPFVKGLFWGIVTPGKLGEFFRAKYLTDKISDISLGKALFTVVFDKLIDFLSTAFISILAIIALIFLFEVKNFFITSIFLAFFISLILFFFIKKDLSKRLLNEIFKIFIPKSLEEKTNVFIDEFFEGTKNLNKTLIFKLFYYDIVTFLLTTISQFFIGFSLSLKLPFWYLFLTIPLVSLITILPISILGIGTREVSYIFLLSLLGINLNEAVAFSFLVMLWSLISGLPGLFFLYFQKEKFLKYEY